jgi:hypothetical protein
MTKDPSIAKRLARYAAQQRGPVRPPPPRFIPARWAFTCTGCGARQDEGEPLLLVDKDKLCADCGAAYLETEK